MLCTHKHRFYLATTRFNRETWKQNETYRERKNIDGCIYGTPMKIARTIPLESYMFIIEMMNLPKSHPDAPGKIMGIGYIKNVVYTRKRHKIYNDNNYNRYHYTSELRIGREVMKEEDESMLELLETMVFRGYSHLKRGQGITCVPNKKLENRELRKTIKKYIFGLFLKHFSIS